MKQLVIGLSGFTTVGIVIYWVLVFTGVFKVIEVIPGYRNWFMAFLLADAWIAICSLLTAIFLFLDDEKTVLFGLLTGSSLIFLRLYALLYGITTGLIFHPTTDNIIEILTKLYCLSVGAFFIIYFWHLRNTFGNIVERY
ncbi:TPA: hypothetical protein DCX16_06000 [bacterium]|nr:hypothetical protein [bacterium]